MKAMKIIKKKQSLADKNQYKMAKRLNILVYFTICIIYKKNTKGKNNRPPVNCLQKYILLTL